MAASVNPVKQNATKFDLEHDRRDVKDLWNDALRAYKGIIGEDLKPTFSNVDTMIKTGVDQMNNFHKWRHDDSKVDKLRSLFMANIGYVETGTQKLIAAAEPAFPPAAAIGTAITFILSACKSVSADYDVITAFFEDMNSFLQRVSILEARLPTYRAYQACLMDVFTSLLKMCAFAQKFIKLGRLKKWVINAFRGEDDDLAGSRKEMDKALVRLQSATEFAILANTENLIQGQHDLQSMQNELKRNQEMQFQLAESQQLMLSSMLEQQAVVHDEIGDIKRLVQALQRTDASEGDISNRSRFKSTANAVRSVVGEIPENDLQLQMMQDSRLPGTCAWFFEEPLWKSWYRISESANSTPLLLLKGSDGIGKSHLAAAIYERISGEIEKDPGSFSCVMYFLAQDGIASLRSFQSIINCAILQISEQNTGLRDQLNVKLSKDGDRIKDVNYLKELLIPLFDSASRYRLYMVIDAVDALETNIDRDSVFELGETIKLHNLHIKIVATARPHVKHTKKHELSQQNSVCATSEFTITKEKILPDLRIILQNRLESTDSAFGGIRYMSPRIKQIIASNLEEKADSPLYVEQALLYMSGLGREATISRLLAENMPLTAIGWYYRLIKKCERRTPADLHAPVDAVITWLLFSFDSLSLAGLNRLLQMESGKDDLEVEDEIISIYGEFLQLQSTAVYAEGNALRPPTSASQLELAADDGDTQLIFRERSMRNFFLKRQAASRAVGISITTNFGHRRLFLICCRVICEHQGVMDAGSPPEGYRDLHQYALTYVIRHWRRISCEVHSNEDNAEIYEAFLDLVSGKTGFANQIENAGLAFTIDELLTFHKHAPDTDWDRVFFDGWTAWSKWLQEGTTNPDAAHLRSCLTSSALEYWTEDRTHALVPLAKSHLENWLRASRPNRAIISYNFARKALRKTFMNKFLCQQAPVHMLDYVDDDCGYGDVDLKPAAWHDEILRLRDVTHPESHSNSHFATAALTKVVFENSRFAYQEMESAIEKCNVDADKARYLVYYGKLLYWSQWKVEDALRYFDLGFELRSVMSTKEMLFALHTKAMILKHSGMDTEALATFQEIRSLDIDKLITDSLLSDEFRVHHGRADWSGLMKYYLDLKPIERLDLVLNRAHFWLNPPFGSVHFMLLDAVIETGQVKELTRTYSSIVASLNANNMGPVWAPWLAHVHWGMEGDAEAAKAVLIKALDAPYTDQEYPLVEMDSGFIAIRNINMMSDILFEQFQSSKDPDSKAMILEEQATGLLQRHLPQSVQINSASSMPHLLVVANMTRKIGRPQDYERIMRQIFDISWTNLHDTITWNDSSNLCNMSRIVAQIPTMRREAEILNSSQLYHLGDHSFLAGYAGWMGIKVDDKLGIDLECAETEQSARKLIDQAEALTVDHDELFNAWREYKEKNPGGYGIYPFLLGLGDPEVLKWDSSAVQCTRLVCCSDKPRDSWTDGPLYTCLTCTDSRLCQECYDVRMEWNKEGKPDGALSFCCSNGRYIKSPAPNWLGIKHHYLYLEGEKPVLFEDFLEQVKARWNQYWDTYWVG